MKTPTGCCANTSPKARPVGLQPKASSLQSPNSGGERQAGHRCHEPVDRRGALHMQCRVKVAADRPDDDQQEDDDAGEGQWNQERRFAEEIDHRWIVLGRKSCR